MVDTIEIRKERYLKLLDHESELISLESGGVDDWRYYYKAIEKRQIAIDCDELGENIVWRNV